MKLAGRHAIITGASRGLGACIAEKFVEAGASVLMCARDPDMLGRVADGIASRAGPKQKVIAHPADVSRPDQVEALVKAALERFPQVDILVNNAGIHGPIGPFEDSGWEDWQRAFQVNLMGSAHACRTLLPHLKSRRSGKIINISGGGATRPLPGMSAYAASKAALVRFTETLAEEVRSFGIDVNAVAPGTLATRLLDEVVAAGPEKVGAAYHDRISRARAEGGTSLEVPAALCVYLASGESNGITGKLIAAVWDPWADLHKYADRLRESDIYTLRRIVPEDRGFSLGSD